jgi:hypothetical protein
MSTPDLAVYADHFSIKESVVENLYEEYELEAEAFDYDISFFEFLVEEFAQAAYLNTALRRGDVVECLEAYDNVYTALTDD